MRHLTKFSTRNLAKDERGAVLFLVALVLPVIVAMGALVIDLGNGWENRRELQNCADAAALAAARDLPDSFAAFDTAAAYLENCMQPDEVAVASVDAEIDRNGDGLSDAIEVINSRTISFGLARIFGATEGEVETRAVAGKVQPEELYGLEPFGVQVDLPPDPVPASCGRDLSYYTIAGIPLAQGLEHTIKFGPNNNPVPSNAQALDLNGPANGQGADEYRDDIQFGYQGWIGTCDTVWTKNGNGIAGPTEQGLNNRINGAAFCDETHVPWSECPWIVTVALVPPLGNGAQPTTALTFAHFVVTSYWNQGANAGFVEGRFVNLSNHYLPGGQFKGEAACDPDLGLPCGLKLLE